MRMLGYDFHLKFPAIDKKDELKMAKAPGNRGFHRDMKKKRYVGFTQPD
jgi:hypothetical protein